MFCPYTGYWSLLSDASGLWLEFGLFCECKDSRAAGDFFAEYAIQLGLRYWTDRPLGQLEMDQMDAVVH
jgi:hypothetical protein